MKKAKYNHKAESLGKAAGVDRKKLHDRFNKLAVKFNNKATVGDGYTKSELSEALEKEFSKRELAVMYTDEIQGNVEKGSVRPSELGKPTIEGFIEFMMRKHNSRTE